MDTTTWTDVDRYLAGHLRPRDEHLDAALADGAGLPQIQVSDLLAGMLAVLARTVGARRILEVGTLFGFSAIVLARTLPPDGRLITLEYAEDHAQVARRNIERAGLDDRVEVRVGPAVQTLPQVAEDTDAAPFDLVFIDADKQNNPTYWDWALRLTRPGGLIVVDNVARGGRVADESSTEPDVLGTRELIEVVGRAVAAERVDASALQTVGAKEYDGVLVACVR